MALARVTTWTSGQILTAAALNAEFNNILNNPISLISPATANLDIDNFEVLDLRLENLSSQPSAAQAGRVFWNTTDVTMGVDTGSRVLTLHPERKNLLLNGDFRVAQRGAGPFTSATFTVNNDDAYLLDNWIFLADGADTCDVSQTSVADAPTGSYAGIQLDIETANRKFGILQVIEARDARRAIGGTVSLSFKARVLGTTIANLRAAIISWDGTADTVTSDIISAWEVVGTNPTLVANWTYENTPANLAVTETYQTFRIENIAVDTASTTNVGVFIWNDDTTVSVADMVRISDVQLEVGRSATEFEHQPFAAARETSRRFFYRTGVVANTVVAAGFSNSTTAGLFSFTFPVAMRAAPTLTPSAAGDFDVLQTGTSSAVTALTLVGASTTGTRLDATTGATQVAGEGILLRDDTGGVAFLQFSAEL